MKKLVLLSAIMLFTMLSFGQALQKGNLVGTHVMTVSLQSSVSMDQFIKFYKTKYIPAFEKNYPGVKIFMLIGDRGEKKNQIGEILYFESVKVRDKYWPVEDTSSDFEKAAAEKMKPIDEEFRKLVVDITNDYTDWVIK